MTRSRSLSAAGPRKVVVALLVVALVAAAAILAWPRGPVTSLPKPTDAPATGTVSPPRVPIAVTAAHRGSEPAMVGVPATISAHALGETSITRLELWAGDERIAEHAAAFATPALTARWTWTPSRDGLELLTVRAVDALGRTRQSNAVWVQVQPGDSAASVPRARLASAVDDGSEQPAVPALQAVLDGCEATVDMAGISDATGFVVYGLPPGGFTFTPLATLAANLPDPAYAVPVSQGVNAIVVGTFDESVEVLSAPMLVDVPEECGAGSWDGGVALDDGHLVGGPPVDRGYLYLRQGTGAAARVPAHSFVSQVGGTLDFGPHLPALAAGEPIHLEAWGWQGGTLIEMGSGTWTPQPEAPTGGLDAGPAGVVAPNGGPVFAPGVITSLDVIRSSVVPGPQPCGKEFCSVELLLKEDEIVWPTQNGQPSPKRTLRWTTQMPLVDSIAWQVLPYAPPALADLAPPYVVDQGVIDVAPGTTSGEFELDFGDYLGPQSVSADLASPYVGPVSDSPVFIFPGAPTPTPPPSPTPNAGGSAGAFVPIPIGQVIPSKITNQAYVRIIPMQGTVPAIVSNHVRFDIVPPPDPMMIDAPPGYSVNENAYTVTWSFTPPKAANPAYARCAVVTGFAPSYVPPPGLWPETYAIGDVKCYDPPDDDGGVLDFIEDGFEAFVDLVEDVWEGITDGYAWIQDQIVKAILATVPCDAIASDAVCTSIAKTALSVALAAVGVPPTLPDFGTVMSGLKGDLRTLVLEAAQSQFPGVAEACGLASAGNVVSSKVATCEALVDEAIDEVVAQIEAEVSSAAGAATGKAWPGVIFAPDPRGVYQVPTVTMTLTRTSDPKLPSQCTASARMVSTKPNHSWPELVGGYPKTATGTVSGQPFLAEGFTVPPMDPGETLTRTVWLAEPATWHESQAAWMYWYYYEALAKPNRAWVLLTAGAELTFEVGGNCMPTSQKGPHVLTQSATGN